MTTRPTSTAPGVFYEGRYWCRVHTHTALKPAPGGRWLCASCAPAVKATKSGIDAPMLDQLARGRAVLQLLLAVQRELSRGTAPAQISVRLGLPPERVQWALDTLDAPAR